jgi:hypothetical protein
MDWTTGSRFPAGAGIFSPVQLPFISEKWDVKWWIALK